MSLGNLYDLAGIGQRPSTPIYKDDRFEVIRISLNAGGLLKPHYSNTDGFLAVLDGEIIFNLEDEKFALKRGDMITFKSRQMHAINALTNCVLLLVK